MPTPERTHIMNDTVFNRVWLFTGRTFNSLVEFFGINKPNDGIERLVVSEFRKERRYDPK